MLGPLTIFYSFSEFGRFLILDFLLHWAFCNIGRFVIRRFVIGRFVLGRIVIGRYVSTPLVYILFFFQIFCLNW